MTVITASGVAEHDYLGLCKWKWLFYLPSDFSALLSFCCSLSILPSCCHFIDRLCNLWQPGCLSLSMSLLWDRVSSGGAFALFVPWVMNRAPWDFPCLPADSGESRSLLLSASPPAPPLSSGPIQRPRWPARALAGPNIVAEQNSTTWVPPPAPAAHSYWQALHKPVNQPPAPGDWVAEKDCHLANCSGHAPHHYVCIHACVCAGLFS